MLDSNQQASLLLDLKKFNEITADKLKFSFSIILIPAVIR